MVRWSRIAPVMMLATVVLVFLQLPERGAPEGRGFETASPAQVQLRIAVDRGGRLLKMHEAGDLEVGDGLVFRVKADQQTTLYTRNNGPEGEEQLPSVSVQHHQDIGLQYGGGALVYEFDTPGRYLITLSTAKRACVSPSCVIRWVSVGE